MSYHKDSKQPSIKRQLYYAISITILISLFFIPYRELRIERIRAFGENKTVGIVLDKTIRIVSNKSTDNSLKRFMLRYSFVAPSGLAIERTANVYGDYWRNVAKGDSILVYYAKAEPVISRVKHEEESTVVQFLSNFSRHNAQ